MNQTLKPQEILIMSILHGVKDYLKENDKGESGLSVGYYDGLNMVGP